MIPQNIAVKRRIDFIIFGSGNYNSLGVLHTLADAGKDAFVLCVGKSRDRKHGNIIGHSRFAKHLLEVSDAEEGVKWLIENKSMFPESTIIYPTGDVEEKALDKEFENLKSHYVFPSCSHKGEVSRLMEKSSQIELAASHGLRIIRSQYSNSPVFSFDKVEYPCMAKPLDSTAGTKGDMRICQNEEELKEALKTGKHTTDFIVQKYINNEADHLFLGVALPDGEVVIPALVKKPGVSPTGEYSHAIITTEIDKHLPEKEKVISFVKSLEYTGPFSIEFGLENGKNYFFEINLRNDGTSHYPLKAGVNIPLIYYNSIRGLTQKSTWRPTEYEMIDEVADLRRVLNRQLSLSAWIKGFRKAGSYKYYYKKDKRLLLQIVPMFLNRSLSKLIRIFN